MIAIDSSETNSRSTLPDLEGVKIVDGLEAMTGADAMISPLDMPCSKPGLIKEHIEEGRALLLQIKRGLDLAASVGTRLNESLIRMREAAPSQFQRVLLFVGTLACDSDGRAIIDGRRVDDNVPGVNWLACQSALDRWSLRRGVVMQLSRIGLLSGWLKHMEKYVKEVYREPQLFVFPEKPTITNDSEDPFEVLVKINDWRVPMAWLIGPAKAQKMYVATNGNGGMAFHHLSDPDSWDHLPKGVYRSDAEKFIERMRIPKGWIMDMRRYSNGGQSEDY